MAEPGAAARRQGVRDATSPAPACAQGEGEVAGGSRDEDCLYLNVTAPATGAGKPVVGWVHGGGFHMGPCPTG